MTHSRARIIFAGSPEFAVPSLKALLNSGHSTVAVLTQPDRPAGRGRKLMPGPVKLAALDANIPVLQPTTLRDHAIQQTLSDMQPDLMVVVAYGQLLPPEVLRLPRIACLNVHASLLPRWRGASPVQAAILAGDVETGISLMQMNAGLDTGPVYCATRMAVRPDETAEQLQTRLARSGGELLAASLDAILAGRIKAVPQPDFGITYAGRINKADGVIDWSRSAVDIHRQIRAFNPWPVAQTLLHGEQLRCWSATLPSVSAASDRPPGTVLGIEPQGIVVQTGNGSLVLTEVQAAGRKRMPAAEFAHARVITPAVLGG